MLQSARLGRYELATPTHAPPDARVHRVRSANDALSWLRRLRLSPAQVRRLVGRSAGARSGRDEDALRALAGLLARGTYVLFEHAPPERIVMVLDAPVETEAEVLEPIANESERDEKPPAIVPYEYPRCASRIESGLWAAEKAAERELERQLYNGLGPEPAGRIQDVYREVAERAGSTVSGIVGQVVTLIERQLFTNGSIPRLADTVPQTYVQIAAQKGERITAQVNGIADRLDRLLFSSAELSRAIPPLQPVRGEQ
jgi:hypothetical protein